MLRKNPMSHFFPLSEIAHELIIIILHHRLMEILNMSCSSQIVRILGIDLI